MTSVHSVVVVEDNGVVSAQRENVTYTQSGKDIRGTKMEISRVCFFCFPEIEEKNFKTQTTKTTTTTAHTKNGSPSL